VYDVVESVTDTEKTDVVVYSSSISLYNYLQKVKVDKEI